MDSDNSIKPSPYPWARSAIVVFLASFALNIALFLHGNFSKSLSPLSEAAPHTFAQVWIIVAFIAVVWMGAKMLNSLGKFIAFSVTCLIPSFFIFFAWLLLAFILPIPNPIKAHEWAWQYYGVNELMESTINGIYYSDAKNDFILLPGMVYSNDSITIRKLRKQRQAHQRSQTSGLIGFRSWQSALVAGFIPDKSIADYSEPITTRDKVTLFLTIGPAVLLDIFIGSLILIPGYIYGLWDIFKKGKHLWSGEEG